MTLFMGVGVSFIWKWVGNPAQNQNKKSFSGGFSESLDAARKMKIKSEFRVDP